MYNKKQPTMNIRISSATHKTLRDYCEKRCLKIGAFVGQLIQNEIDKGRNLKLSK